MLILNPELVRFVGAQLTGVTAVAVERSATKLIEDHDEIGPFVTFVDVPQQRTRLKIVQSLSGGDLPGNLCGDSGLLEVWTSPNASQASRLKLAATAMIIDVRYEIGRKGAVGPAAVRIITFSVIASTGKIEPLVFTDASTGTD